MNGLLGDSKDLKKALGGEPAFPKTTAMAEALTGNQTDFHTEGGLTKREYFAAMAMQALIANDVNLAAMENVAPEMLEALKNGAYAIEESACTCVDRMEGHEKDCSGVKYAAPLYAAIAKAEGN